MLKKIIQISLAVAFSAALFGCALTHKPVTCDQLKSQQLYYSTNRGVEASWTTSTQRDALHQKMVEANCL